MVFIGIDPGKTGGIAAVGQSRDFLYCARMPTLEKDLLSVLHKMATCTQGPAHIFIEDVNAMPHNGVVSMFKFGQEFGKARMAAWAVLELTDATGSVNYVKPQKWQSVLGLKKTNKNESYPQRKRRLMESACEMYAHHKNEICGATSDAVLIAEYGRRIITGGIS